MCFLRDCSSGCCLSDTFNRLPVKNEIKFKYMGPSTYYVTSMGGGGVCKMMTYDDRGDDVINKGSFLEQYPKKITQSFVAISYLLCFYV